MNTTMTANYRVIATLTNDFGAYNHGHPSQVDETIKWQGTDLDVLSILYPPSRIWGADPLGHSEIEDGLIRYDYRFERQRSDGSWERIDDPRRRLTPVTALERATDAENRFRSPGDFYDNDNDFDEIDDEDDDPQVTEPVSDKVFLRGLAVQLADFMLRAGRNVKGIELFGSIARGNLTAKSDFDMILCVDNLTAARWFRDVQLAIDQGSGESIASIRRRLALQLIGIDPVDLEAATGILPWKQDYFLFPVHWRQLLDQLQSLGHHRDPNFMQNIAHDALTFVPNQGFPFSVFSW